MNGNDIKTLVQILRYKDQSAIADTLLSSKSEIQTSGQYGQYWNSEISTFIILAPIPEFYKLKNLKEDERKVLFESILELYPPAENSYEITDLEIRILKADDLKETMSTKTGVEIFISYSTIDKLIAGEVKRALTDVGFTVFLAHEDIKPSSEWIDVILDNLNSADIFIPLLSFNFQGSDWTDQESGFALAKSKLIIPVSVDGKMPYGFINRFQAMKFNRSIAYSESSKIIDVIIEKSKSFPFNYRLINSFIQSLEKTSSFDSAGKKMNQIIKLDFDNDQVNKIFSIVAGNNQIYNSSSAGKPLKILFEKYKNKIGIETAKNLKLAKPSLFF